MVHIVVPQPAVVHVNLERVSRVGHTGADDSAVVPVWPPCDFFDLWFDVDMAKQTLVSLRSDIERCVEETGGCCERQRSLHWQQQS